MEKRYTALILIFSLGLSSLYLLNCFLIITNLFNNFSPDIYTKPGWMWVSGDKTSNIFGVYGIKGVPNILNCPGSRDGTVSWTDSDDNLWLFGGWGRSEDSGGRLNDLWKFDGVSWTWMSGSKNSNINGVYGVKGVPSATNYPGSRDNAISWKDSDGNFWLFGGEGYSESGTLGWLNDLWKFDGTNWIWMSGSKTVDLNGVYGTMGVPSAGNYPGSRNYAHSWSDSEDNLWLFGGYGFPESGGVGRLNDLWKFDGTNWIWVSGNENANVNGVYGIKGIPNVSNYPGSRNIAYTWTDSNDNLWLFGGYGYPESGTFNRLNDLWKFDGTSWTWISGSKTTDVYGVYGSKGVPSVINHPGSRSLGTSWTDSNDNLWFFGGYGFTESGGESRLNDLWIFDGEYWTWLSGNKTTNVYGVYGAKGIPDDANCPGARSNPISWKDSDDNFWLFGGEGHAEPGWAGFLNDLWKCVPYNIPDI